MYFIDFLSHCVIIFDIWFKQFYTKSNYTLLKIKNNTINTQLIIFKYNIIKINTLEKFQQP